VPLLLLFCLGPKCTETRSCPSVSSTTFAGLYPGPRFKVEGRHGKKRVGLEGMEGIEWKRTDEGEGKEGGEGEGRDGE
jgi:hypothetical protein